MLTAKRYCFPLLKLALVFFAGHSLAADSEVPSKTLFDDGVWEITILKTLTNLNFPPRPVIDKQCITNQGISEGHLPLHVMRHCTVVPGRFRGSELELKISCGEDSNVIASGTLQFQRTAFQGKAEILEKTDKGPGEGIRIAYDAKRIGPCAKE